MTTQGVVQSFGRVPCRRRASRRGHAVGLGLVALLASSLVACVAEVGAGEGDDKVAACEGEGCAAVRADEAQNTAAAEVIPSNTTLSAASPTAIPPAGTGGPDKPQPSPWKPNNPSNPSDPGDELTDPAAGPQPSPWQGHAPSNGAVVAPAVQNVAALE